MYNNDPDTDLHTDICAIDTHVATGRSPVPYSLKLYDRSGVREAGTCLPPTPPTGERMRKAWVTLAPTCEVGRKQLIVLGADEYNDIASYDLIPNDFGQEEDTVKRLRMLIRDIGSQAMEKFLDDVFCLRTVFHRFWIWPASRGHHHARRGGLAAHSIEMAEWVANTDHMSAEERDIGVAYALLHDIGKLWCYRKGGYTEFHKLGHEIAGLTHINTELDDLHGQWPDGCIALRSLLSGMWKANRTRPIMAVGELVRAFDQSSAEQDRRTGKCRGSKPWAPRPEIQNAQW